MIEYKELKDNYGLVYKKKWPYKNNVKALSPSAILQPVYQIAYGNFQNTIGMEQGKQWEQAITMFLNGVSRTRIHWLFTKEELADRFHNQAPLIKEVVGNKIKISHRIGHTTYKKHFIACENDIENRTTVFEIKKNDKKAKWTYIMFQVQMYIQKLCFKKKVLLLWSNKEQLEVIKLNKKLAKHWLNLLLEIRGSDNYEAMYELLEKEYERWKY